MESPTPLVQKLILCALLALLHSLIPAAEFRSPSYEFVKIDAINGWRYVLTEMIQSFACAETAKIFSGSIVRRFPPDIQRTARRKLLQLHASVTIRDMAVPPGNRLEALKGRRAGQHSIRVNDQWRVCFRWLGSDAYDVEIVDYH